MQRITHKLNARGVRSFRMDLRGCGAGHGLSRLPYHSGRSEDAAAAIEFLAQSARLAFDVAWLFAGWQHYAQARGRVGGAGVRQSRYAMAVCPPTDLAACSRQIARLQNRMYDRHFVRLLLKQIASQRQVVPDAAEARFERRPRSLWEFDNSFTAVVCGFGTAEDDDEQASSLPLLTKIQIPTQILSAADDPMIPPGPLLAAPLSPAVRLHMAARGGHLGFVGRGGVDADRRWMDWRVVDWVLAQPHPQRSKAAVAAR